MANLNSLDLLVLVLFFISTLYIGWRTMRKAGQSSSEFFLSGRSIPWWLLGFSLVATTFSADTPNLVTDIVRRDGVAGNWCWWAFLPTGLTTVFSYGASLALRPISSFMKCGTAVRQARLFVGSELSI